MLTVVASDHGSPPRSATQLLTVSVADVNDEAPSFPQAAYHVHVPENRPPGTTVLTLHATDPDLGTVHGDRGRIRGMETSMGT